MTIGEWVTDRGIGAPAQLVAGVRAALGTEASRPAADASAVLLDAAGRELAMWLASDLHARAGAVPLLTIDALVTLALEAAADRPDTIDSVAENAITRLSWLTKPGTDAGPDSQFPIPDSRNA